MSQCDVSQIAPVFDALFAVFFFFFFSFFFTLCVLTEPVVFIIQTTSLCLLFKGGEAEEIWFQGKGKTDSHLIHQMHSSLMLRISDKMCCNVEIFPYFLQE